MEPCALGVLDIGSNTGHLLVVDAHGGAAPLPAFSFKQPLRLAEHLDEHGRGVAGRASTPSPTFTADALRVAEDKGCEDMLGVRHLGGARRGQLRRRARPRARTAPASTIEVLTGEDEARLTFLAVRRWFGWSAGRLAVFDIGGGSLEIAGRRRRGARRRAVAAARRGAAGRATYFSGGAARRGRPCASCAADPRRDRPRRGQPAARRRARPRGRHLEDVPLARADLRRGAVGGRPLVPRALPLGELAEWIPKLVGDATPRTSRSLPGRLAEPHPPDRAGRAGRRGVHGHLRPRRARDLPVGAARGRHPRAPRPARRSWTGRPALTRIGLSTSSVYPESTAHAFAYAASVGYDAVEVMVGIDALSQQTAAVKQLSEHHEMPVCAIHAPCLLFTQRVWGTEPWGKLERSAEMAAAVGAEVVVVHPPFRWQREYARDFVDGIAALEESTGIAFAVENMYPWRASRRGDGDVPARLGPLRASPTPTPRSTSPTPRSPHADPVAMAERLGDRLRHVHLTDGTGSAKDEHLVPGRGAIGAADFLRHLAAHRLRRRDRARDQHPQVRRRARSARPTCGSRWSSRASTSRSARPMP